MRNKIMGSIGIIWGGAIVVRTFFVGVEGSGAYRSGQMGGVILGVLLLGAGLYYFFKAAPKKA